MAEGMIKFTGFAPDLDPMTPGIMLDCDKIYPTLKGFRPTNSPVPFFKGRADVTVPGLTTYDKAGDVIFTYESGSLKTYDLLSVDATYSATLPGPALGAFRARYLDGTEALFAGTAHKLWMTQNNSLWVDMSSGQEFHNDSTTPAKRWRFAQFGNDVLATNGVDPVQRSRSAAGFQPLPGNPPKADIVVAVNNFVFLLHTSTESNQWWCSGIGTDDIWDPDIATQAARNILTETAGAITAAKPLGPDLITYKLRSMYDGQYLGPPPIWGFPLLSKETGAPCQEAVVELADAHAWPGYDDFYTYNGGRPLPLRSPLREFFFKQSLDQDFQDQIIGRWDKLEGVVVWHYPSVDASPRGTLDRWIAWHPETNEWTTGTRLIDFAVQDDIPLEDATTYDTAGNVIITYESGSTNSYNTAFPLSSTVGFQAVFGLDHILYTLNGQKEASFILTGDSGDDVTFSYLVRVKPKFAIYPKNPTPPPDFRPVPQPTRSQTVIYDDVGMHMVTYDDGSVDSYDDLFLVTIPPVPNPPIPFSFDPPSLTEFYLLNLGDVVKQGSKVLLDGNGWYHVRRRSHFHRYRMDFPGDYEIIGYEPMPRYAGTR